MKKANVLVDTRSLTKFKNNKNRVDWENASGENIYITCNHETYSFTIIEYDKKSKVVKVMYEGEEYSIYRCSLLRGSIGGIIGTKVVEFRYNVGDIIETKRKSCEIIESFRREDNGEKRYLCKCQDCGGTKVSSESKLMNRGFTCNNCSDKISRPERIFLSILKQLDVKYEYQKLFDWSKKVKFDCDEKSKDKFYDFYVPSLNMIVEVNGELHYRESKWKNSRSLEYVKENDRLKELLATGNGIDRYAVIDCEETEIDYIRESICNSELKDIFDLDKIDWGKCDLDSCVSLMRVCSDLWNEGMESTVDIARKLGLSRNTVITYLKRFSKMGLNNYDVKKEMRSGAIQTQEKNKKKIMCLENNMIFNSVKECVERSEEVFGVKLSQSKISNVCNNIRKHHRGYTFRYIKDM